MRKLTNGDRATRENGEPTIRRCEAVAVSNPGSHFLYLSLCDTSSLILPRSYPRHLMETGPFWSEINEAGCLGDIRKQIEADNIMQACLTTASPFLPSQTPFLPLCSGLRPPIGGVSPSV
jgi:hypothetical protein